ncbi:PIN domain-containing protein [Amycolatopsis coloradensis]|uniref:PIN domain-containing protein n=1 Tax=Amycolatopsis coloradensis TaxID=76021 RepID=A0ACD5B849_9PSEU
MAFVVLCDANVLYPNVLRDFLLRIAQSGFVRAKWTDEILDEVFRNLRKNRPDLDPLKLDRTRQLMNAAVRDCLVTGYEPLVTTLELPDLDDRHVLAAAIKAQARVIVTENLRDFPKGFSAAGTSKPRAPTTSSWTGSSSVSVWSWTRCGA